MSVRPDLRRGTPPTVSEQDAVDAFHDLYYRKRASWGLGWMGHNMLKWPADLFIYAELIHKNRPDVLIETGTYEGGSAQFYADCMERIGKGCVISIDNGSLKAVRPPHPRVLYLDGDSVEMAGQLKEHIEPGWEVMVSLDSGHKKDHVLREMNAYADLVTPGQYMVVEDTNINGHPVYPEYGPGPFEALEEFNDPRFTPDAMLAKRHLFSMHTWLRRDS